MTGKATHAVRPTSWPSQRAVRSDTEHATCDPGHETVAGAASCIHLSRPITRQTIPGPPNLPYTPQGGARSASALLAAPPA
eukprot:1502897-Prymnesium_polylepis.1